jgi:hypothetical protein
MLDVARSYVSDDHFGRAELHDTEFARPARGDTATRHLAEWAWALLTVLRHSFLVDFRRRRRDRAALEKSNFTGLIVSRTGALSTDYTGDLGFQVCRQLTSRRESPAKFGKYSPSVVLDTTGAEFYCSYRRMNIHMTGKQIIKMAEFETI